MNSEARIKKILVILGPEVIEAADPMESPLLKRAAAVSRATGCELELFHVAFDSALDYRLFKSEEELEQQRQMLLDRDATRLAEIAAWLVQEGLKVEQEVRWDYPRADAMLKKIAQSKPDFVMKRQEEHGFLLGITTNTDWDLARHAPSNLWLVHDATDRIDTLVAAVGNKSGKSVEVTSEADRNLLATAIGVGEACEARVVAVNAYELPEVADFAANVGGTVMPVQSAKAQQEARSRIVERHTKDVKALTERYGIDKDDVFLREGHPGSVIPEVAKEVGAGLVVMGARSVGRLERVVSSVTVEPVIAKADCDILVVRDDDSQEIAGVEERPVTGEPRYDLEHAITHPDDTFESPQQVANLSEISVDLRKRILQAWEYDIRAEMVEENEGGPVRDIDVNTLDDILSAKALLDMKAGRAPGNESRKADAGR
ncbi:MAG TPA: universal stress protein [Woeseiaceae bacterium]|nr:universal stress protein [Woeseiaceae bacterium]